MNEYEEAREAIAKKLTEIYKWGASCERDGYYDPDEAQEALLQDADKIMKLPNIAVLAKDQSMPDWTGKWKYMALTIQQDMLKSNFKKVIDE